MKKTLKLIFFIIPISLIVVFWINACREPVDNVFPAEPQSNFHVIGIVYDGNTMTGNIDDLISISNAPVYCNNQFVATTKADGSFDFTTEDKIINMEIRKENYSKSMFTIDINDYNDTIISQQFMIFPIEKTEVITPESSEFTIGIYTFKIPEGAVENNVEVHIYNSGSNNLIGSDTTLKLFGMEFQPKGTTFSKPITISFPLPEFMENTGTITPYIFNEETFAFEQYEGKVEIVNDTIYCEIDHFSIIEWIIGYRIEWEWTGPWTNVGDWTLVETKPAGPFCAGASTARTYAGMSLSKTITITVSASLAYYAGVGVEAGQSTTWTDHTPSETIPICKCCTFKYNIMQITKRRNFKYRLCERITLIWFCSPWYNGYTEKTGFKFTSDTPECTDNPAEECHDQGGGGK